jgi:hypothetical protein
VGEQLLVCWTPASVGCGILVGFGSSIGMTENSVQKGHHIPWIDCQWHALSYLKLNIFLFLAVPKDFECSILFCQVGAHLSVVCYCLWHSNTYLPDVVVVIDGSQEHFDSHVHQ